MRGFKSRAGVEQLSAWIDQRIQPLSSEEIPLGQAAGRILAIDVSAHEPVPSFDRSAMDGFAVHAETTFGASPYVPIALQRAGRSRPGYPCTDALGASEAIEVATGAPLPPGADAVVPVESTRTEAGRVLVFEPVSVGRNVSHRGEDVAAGTRLLPAGRVLRPQDLGLVSAVGAAVVHVIRRPQVAVIVTGDELLPPGSRSRGVQIPDMNSVMLAPLIARDGGTCSITGPVPDQPAAIREAIERATSLSDLILVTGGSSVGPEDHVPAIVAQLGRMIAHGLALRPAGPTGLGLIGDRATPVVLLPGNPVSCLCAYDFVAGHVLRRLAGQPGRWPYRSMVAPLARKLTSAIGRVDYARVRFQSGMLEPISSGGASILSSVSRADGFVIIPAELEGYPPGACVEFWCYDEVPAFPRRANESAGAWPATSPDQSIRSAHQTPLG
jgi:molybdopterin molybdotransferase